MKKPLALIIGVKKPEFGGSKGAPPSFPFSKKPGASYADDPNDQPDPAGQDPEQSEDDAERAKISHAYDLIERACAVLKDLMGSPEGDDNPASASSMGNPTSHEDQLAA